MIRRPPRSTLFPYTSSSDLKPPISIGGSERLRAADVPPLHERTFARSLPRKRGDRKSTRLNSSHANISYAVFCLKKKKTENIISSEYVVLKIDSRHEHSTNA